MPVPLGFDLLNPNAKFKSNSAVSTSEKAKYQIRGSRSSTNSKN